MLCYPKCTLTICEDLDDDEEEEDFQTIALEDDTLDYGRNSRPTFMYTWTFSTT